MPEDWKEVTFGELANWSSGKYLSPSDRSDDGVFPVLGANGVIGRTSTALYKHPVVTVGRVGAIGEVHLTRGPVWVSDNALVAEPRDGVLIEYLALALGNFDYRSIKSGTNQPLVTQTSLKAQVTLLPSIAEQRRIADLIATLDRATDALRRTEASVSRAYSALQEEVYRIALRRMPLGDVAEVTVGPVFASGSFTEDASDPRLLRGINVAAGSARWDATKRWPRIDVSKYGRYWLRSEDVVVAMDATFTATGEMRVARLGPEDLPALLVQRVARLRPLNTRATPGLLYHLLRSARACAGLRDAQTGAFAPHISADDIRATSLPALGAAEARRWERVLEAADQQASRARAYITSGARLRAALLADLMSGAHAIPASYDRFIDGAT